MMVSVVEARIQFSLQSLGSGLEVRSPVFSFEYLWPTVGPADTVV